MNEIAPNFLTVDEVCDLHSDQIRLYGGTEGIRDRSGLESAVAQPQAAFGDEFLRHDLFEMAAAYAFHIAENQPFLDGNKRTALNAAIVFLGINGHLVLDPQGRLYEAMIAISQRELDKNGLGQILQQLSVGEDATETGIV